MKLKHFDHDGRTRFITFCTHKKIPALSNDYFREIVIKSIDNARADFKFQLLGYVIMPEHLHLVLLPAIETKIGAIIGEIKRTSSIEIHAELRKHSNQLLSHLIVHRNGLERFALWQRRCFDHNCRTEHDVHVKVQYCHDNPVRRGLVRKPEQWKWSSHNWYAGSRSVPLSIDSEIILK